MLFAKEAVSIYFQLSDEWEVLSNILFKYSKIKQKAFMERILISLEHIYELENEGIRHLLSIFKEY